MNCKEEMTIYNDLKIISELLIVKNFKPSKYSNYVLLEWTK